MRTIKIKRIKSNITSDALMDIKQLQLADDFPELFINRARRIPIDAIGLPARALNIVASCNAKNSYDAISIILEGFSGISGIGKKTYWKAKQLFISL